MCSRGILLVAFVLQTWALTTEKAGKMRMDTGSLCSGRWASNSGAKQEAWKSLEKHKGGGDSGGENSCQSEDWGRRIGRPVVWALGSISIDGVGRRASHSGGEWNTGRGHYRRGLIFDFVLPSCAASFCYLSLSLLRNMGNTYLENESWMSRVFWCQSISNIIHQIS